LTATDGLLPGDPAPSFHGAALGGNPRYAFDTVGGRHILMLFFGSAADKEAAKALALVNANAAIFNDTQACFFGVTNDPADERAPRIAPSIPGRRYFLDYDRSIATLYRPHPSVSADGRAWILLDPMLRVVAVLPIEQGEAALRLTAHLSRAAPPPSMAPALIVPRILEPAMCTKLIAMYDASSPEESGFMNEIGGKTVLRTDPGHKVRKDVIIGDPAWINLLGQCISRRLVPQIAKSFQFEVTRMERYLIACYEAESGGHFAPHRDNTTKGTAHRRFAVTINLNAEDYDGGDLAFPEFGNQTYRAPSGGAVVFSCSLLHKVAPVTRGRRFAFLPFLYDDAAADMRAGNNAFLGPETPAYVPGSDRI
jgi:2OG-Fe(II) oxygenase superfamily